MRPPKVALICHSLNAAEGAPRSLYEITCGLAQSGRVVPHIYAAGQGSLLPKYRQADIPITTFDENVRRGEKVINSRLERLRRHFKRFLYDNGINFIIANTVKSLPYLKWADGIGIPGICVIRESLTPEFLYSRFGKQAALDAAVGLEVAKAVVFVSARTRELWRSQLPDERVRIIRTGIEQARFSSSMKVSSFDARRILGLPDGLIYLSVGTIGARKNQRQLISWFSRLPLNEVQSAHLVLVGPMDNSETPHIRSLISSIPSKYADRIILTGHSDEVGLYYRAADIFLLNSISESYPRAVLEALSFGLPVIGTSVFGINEQIDSGVNGYTYDIGDQKAWSEKVVLLSTDVTLRENMSSAASRAFAEMGGFEQMISSYANLIGRLAA